MKSFSLIVALFINANILHSISFAQVGFIESQQQLGNELTFGVTLGDLNNDGDLDLFFANIEGSNEVWINNGKGLFTQTSQQFTPTKSYSAALADIDQDGDLDAVTANDGPCQLWLNNGEGIFDLSEQQFSNYDTPGLALGDLNNDGYQDIVFANFITIPDYVHFAPKEIWLNDGAGKFVKSQEIKNYAGRDAALADFDSDGDLDVYFVNHLEFEGVDGNPPDEVWLNDSNGVFQNSGQKLGGSQGGRAATGDIDNDGDIDVIVANPFIANNIWLNDGKGNFSHSQKIIDSQSNSVALGDIDMDGDLDALFAKSTGVTIWLNDGKGSFTKSDKTLGKGESWDVALGDLDSDGDLDVVVANNGINKVYFNNTIATGIISDRVSQLPDKIFLDQNYPNPFNPSTVISYQLSAVSDVKLTIYNMLGQKIKTLVNSFQSAGEHSVTWDATDNSNNSVSSGIYFYMLETNGTSLQKKMILIR